MVKFLTIISSQSAISQVDDSSVKIKRKPTENDHFNAHFGLFSSGVT